MRRAVRARPHLPHLVGHVSEFEIVAEQRAGIEIKEAQWPGLAMLRHRQRLPLDALAERNPIARDAHRDIVEGRAIVRRQRVAIDGDLARDCMSPIHSRASLHSMLPAPMPAVVTGIVPS